MEPLPVLISIPHAGWQIPPELQGRVSLSHRDLSDDVDLYSDEIYDLGSKAAGVLKTTIARSFVDLNRAENEVPPAYPDGVIKTTNCYRRPV